MQLAWPRFWLPLGLLAFLAHATLVPALYSRPRARVSVEMEVAIPRFAQALMAAGDRYLAANLAGFRALVASTENMDAENYRVLGLVQSDISWFNPAHEDNYYIAAAILPWAGEVDAAQRILRAASDSRPFDWQPAFYYAFDAFHFLKNPQEGAEWLRIAADHASDETDKIQLQQVAALWAAKGDDLEMAIRLHRAMAKETKHRAFASFLERRAQRLENLVALERAITRYRELVGTNPDRLSELVGRAILPSLPVDPFGSQYTIDHHGKPQVLSSAAANPAPASESAP